MIQMTALLITGLTIAFVKGWLMTIVTLSIVPFLGFGAVVYGKLISIKE